jgi:AcrR family transcriptional regulator
VARTQEQRRAETRRRLLEAAAARFAERGIDGTSIDAIADAADRTSGAVYDHFGSKEGVLTALLESWTNEAAAVIAAELVVAETLEEQLGALWRNFVRPAAGDGGDGDGGRWIQLEHELWLYAMRNDHVRDQLAQRYRDVWERVVEAVTAWIDASAAAPPVSAVESAPLLVGLLIGLEMQYRVDPSAVTDEMAVQGLCALVGVTKKGSKKR